MASIAQDVSVNGAGVEASDDRFFFRLALAMALTVAAMSMNPYAAESVWALCVSEILTDVIRSG